MSRSIVKPRHCSKGFSRKKFSAMDAALQVSSETIRASSDSVTFRHKSPAMTRNIVEELAGAKCSNMERSSDVAILIFHSSDFLRAGAGEPTRGDLLRGEGEEAVAGKPVEAGSEGGREGEEGRRGIRIAGPRLAGLRGDVGDE